MYTYEEAFTILNKCPELSIEDIQDIHDNFIKSAKLLKNLPDEQLKIETENYCKYLNAMSAVFNERYKNSEMTAEEYQIWKQGFKEDFCDIPADIKKIIKKLFIQKITGIIKSNLKLGKIFKEKAFFDSYDDYYIEGIKDVEFNQLQIHYKYRVIIMLIFVIVIVTLASLIV